jgi:HD superfamily phosphohydrolase
LKQKKIINDPVHGFVSIPNQLIFDVINHPLFQRLRRVTQLGVASYVYPGALHTRFQHALGAMHLMQLALNSLKNKGHKISKKEFQAALLAILLHDIGHGPFSHSLEHSILKGVHHEEISLILMEELNQVFDGKLKLAIKIFTNKYKRKFFHQLVSSQLDMDRLDYLQRDCFFTGVSEGTIGGDRIIKMLDVHEDKIVVEQKGIHSIEHFLNARRMMYWQVYLHKTAVSADGMLIQIIRRAKFLSQKGVKIQSTPNLDVFLRNSVTKLDFRNESIYLKTFSQMDDADIWGSIKLWQQNEDKVLSLLCNMFLNRNLFRIQFGNQEIANSKVEEVKQKVKDFYQFTDEELSYFVLTGKVMNTAYLAEQSHEEGIFILQKNGTISDISEASDFASIKSLGQYVSKFYLAYPKSIDK